jgi:hypothetical protein
MMQELAEIGAGLGLVRIGPQKKREMLAGLRRLTVENQIGEQRLQTIRVDTSD